MTDAPMRTPLEASCSPCRCGAPGFSRRSLLAAMAAWPAVQAHAQTAPPEGVREDVGDPSRFSKLVPAEQIERAAGEQYLQLTRSAATQRALAPASHPQLQRLRAISARLIPYCAAWNARAAQWTWEVNLIGSKDLNAFCMPGGKIAFFYGLLQRLQLSDDEVAVIMGHEMAHALREHAREQLAKNTATRLGTGLVSALLGLGTVGDAVLGMGGQLMTLRFGRGDESEADLVGLDLAARAGYDPRAGVTLWQKMIKASEGAPPEFLSTHPAGATRVRDIEAVLPKVMPLYERAAKPPQKYGPPPA